MNKYELLGYKKKFCFRWVTKRNFITRISLRHKFQGQSSRSEKIPLNRFQQRQASSLHTNSKHNWTKKPDAADSDRPHFPDRIFKSKCKADTHTQFRIIISNEDAHKVSSLHSNSKHKWTKKPHAASYDRPYFPPTEFSRPKLTYRDNCL